jgi:hypothetical protein
MKYPINQLSTSLEIRNWKFVITPLIDVFPSFAAGEALFCRSPSCAFSKSRECALVSFFWVGMFATYA